MQRIVILGGGSGGTVAARRLRKHLSADEAQITVVDQSAWHTYQPSLLWVMTGKREINDIRMPLVELERYDINVVRDRITAIDATNQTVSLDAGDDLPYDHLIVSLGVELHNEICGDHIPCPWTPEGAMHARKSIGNFTGGKIVVGAESWPYRCPPAPFEVAFMLRYIADQRGLLHDTTVDVFHTWTDPMESFGPLMVDGFNMYLKQFGVNWNGNFHLADHDPTNRRLTAADGRHLDYDLAIVIPPHKAPALIAESGLATDTGFMDVGLDSLAHPTHANIYGVGDIIAPTLGLGMAGVFAHFQAEHVATRITDEIKGTFLGELYNMVGICVMDMGYVGAAVWCDFESKLRGESEFADCRMLGGMRSFRAVKTAFEKYWFANLFGHPPNRARNDAYAQQLTTTPNPTVTAGV